MNNKVKISIAAGAVAVASAACAFTVMLTKDKVDIPTVSVLEISELPPPEPIKVDEEIEWWENEEYSLFPSGQTGRAKNFLNRNDDIIGWIKLDKTNIDFPIVLDPGDICAEDNPENVICSANSYYLDKDLDGSHLTSGTLFMDYRNVFGEVESEQSDNLVVYGHNMIDNSAFGSLRRYRQDYSFYAESPLIELSSNYRDYQYIIFGFIITSGSYDATDFRYWNMENFESEEDFNFYVDRVQSKSLVDTGVDVQYGDKLLTLSTCYSGGDNMRFIVCARRLRDHESSIDTIDRTEAYLEKIRQEEAAEAAAEAEAASQAATT